MKKIAFIGAGSMAEAIIAGLVNKNFVRKEQIYVSNKDNLERLNEIENKYGAITTTDKQKTIKDADVVFIATKPYDIEGALHDVSQYLNENQLVISVVAGISTKFIQSKINKEIPVIRSMPNTSATIGYSATAISKGNFAIEEHIEIATTLFTAIGTVSVVEEKQMDIVTAISGSGPAYVYYLVEAMQKAAVDEGLKPETAKQLINQTIVGAGNMLSQSSDRPEVLRENVTSPNGTTAAGIATLKDNDFKNTVISCVKSAMNRSIELGKNE